MNFDWEYYLHLAEELIDDNAPTEHADQEARIRSSISRAYYSAFNCARFFLSDKRGETIETNNAHNGVRELLINHGFPEDSNRLNQLRKARNKADYTPDWDADKKELAKKCLIESRRVVQQIKKQK